MKLNLKANVVDRTHIVNNKILVSFIITLLLFLGLTKEVVEGRLDAWDQTFMEWVRHFHQPGLFEFARVSYFLGEAEVVVFFVLALLGFFAWKRYWKEAQVLAISALGILILIDQILKPLFGRIRPAPGLIDVHGKSYPSGHVSGNFMLYLYISYIVAFRFPKLAIYLYGISTLLALLIGWSSLYLHVHWATDIIAGFAVGYLAFTLSIILLKVMDKKYQNF
ncbi:phosphoesterase PA-phosphatase related [Rippkaea orientalis PCC 8801]|uniref:Phosphoesterase PA-phosphatase related n=1 Tax=Rippkaea orientalis (strain PCC 8801 / RF-1) TaxID=41431 RepID=B7K4K3_RIPO1|nr:phosphatase PAP2 family protein [Rippkaea orientalis]ACK65468.1 phosphoesterase PA-phosphatase related [Rippkaea orientalis PCC 8801]